MVTKSGDGMEKYEEGEAVNCCNERDLHVEKLGHPTRIREGRHEDEQMHIYISEA
jgi:hypothetical protein